MSRDSGETWENSEAISAYDLLPLIRFSQRAKVQLMRSSPYEMEVQAMGFLDYVECEAKENIRFHLASTDVLKKEAHTLVALQLVASGASFGYTVDLIREPVSVVLFAAMLATTVYLLLLGAATATACLMQVPVQAPANEPGALLIDGYELDAVRLVELQNLQERITETRAQNAKTGQRLNSFRLLTLGTPALFVLVYALASSLAS